MQNTVDFEILYKSACFESFDELQDCAGHTDPLLVVLEAIHLHAFYERQVKPGNGRVMVVHNGGNNIYTLDDTIAEGAPVTAIMPFSVPEADFAALPPGFTPDNIADRVSRALRLYEQVKLAEGSGMKMGIYIAAENRIAQYSLAFTADINGQTRVFGAGAGPKGMHLQ